MLRDLRTAFVSMIVFTVILGLAYPLLTTGISQGLFPGKANGSLVKRSGVIIGSSLIGQQFYAAEIAGDGRPVTKDGVVQTAPDAGYFQTRPSSTSDNDAATAFSNLGPNGKATLTAFKGYIETYLELNKGPNGAPYDPAVTRASQIPVDAVSDSASSVDPNISVANARIQAYRIAAVRQLSLARVDALIANYTSARGLGFLGEPGVDVLNINLALDRITGGN